MDSCICSLMRRLPKKSKQFSQCTRFKKMHFFSAWWNYDVLIDFLFGNTLLSRVEIISIESIQDKDYIPSKESNQTVTPFINLVSQEIFSIYVKNMLKMEPWLKHHIYIIWCVFVSCFSFDKSVLGKVPPELGCLQSIFAPHLSKS